ncbi:DUF2059 domain-containing protein [Aquimarina spinulae]|uniref:DUF2059 domain-containing protein n=1 Tax=Aquimarina spinulae TaxID=1192023 RepID=UPI000D5627DE|nr:DUF2059 domain-containing protein [Aquimarina spinulae]
MIQKILLLLFTFFAFQVNAQNINKKIEKFLKLNGTIGQMEKTITKIIEQEVQYYYEVFGNNEELVKKKITEKLLTKFKSIIIPIYSKTYTESDIDNYITFYSSEAGKAITEKTLMISEQLDAAKMQMVRNLEFHITKEIKNLKKEKFEEKKNEVIKDFSNFKSYELTDLIPFRIEDYWGYIDRKTNNIVIPAKYGNLEFFHPNMTGHYKGEVGFDINRHGDISFFEHQEIVDIPFEKICRAKIISSHNKGYKGFKVDEEGSLSEYSDIYKEVKPFKKGDKYYAIAILKTNGQYGIITTSGKRVKGFDFTQKKILLNKDANDEKNVWFFVQNDYDLWSLKNFNGKIKFKDEILSSPSPITTFGLSIMRKDEVFAIFDCYKMEWVVKPQIEIIENITYTSKAELNKFKYGYSHSDREYATIYYSIEENDLTYFVDLKGNKYKPVE